MKNADKNNSSLNNYYHLIFQIFKSFLCPELKTLHNRNKLVVWYTKKWDSLEHKLFQPKPEEEKHTEEEIETLKAQLRDKYAQPVI